MKLNDHIFVALFSLLFQFSFSQTETTQKKNTIFKIEMNLSAIGVESDDFPSIDAMIDFKLDSNICIKTFFNPAFDNQIYYLTNEQIEAVKSLLENTDLGQFKEEYTVPVSDQPTSTTKIATSDKTYVIRDYGLKGDETLTKLYQLVYRINE